MANEKIGEVKMDELEKVGGGVFIEADDPNLDDPHNIALGARVAGAVIKKVAGGVMPGSFEEFRGILESHSDAIYAAWIAASPSSITDYLLCDKLEFWSKVYVFMK